VTIFSATIGYHTQEPDAISHQKSMPDVDSPEDLVDAAELLKYLIGDAKFTKAKV